VGEVPVFRTKDSRTGETKELIFYDPAYVEVRLSEAGDIIADIVDPHGVQFADALLRLRGLARYAEQNPGIYRRIEIVARIGNKFRVIDLTEASVRAAALAAKTITEVYESDVATDYLA
jgi:type III restriction enzyme